ncbi:MAG: sugar phosphate isomerase/epimerase family protein, partial [Anaerolineae bacterium]
ERLEETVRLAETLGAEVVVLHLPAKLRLLNIRVGEHSWLLPLLWQRDPEGIKDWMQSGLAAYQDTTPVRIAVENLPERRFLGRRIEPIWWSTLQEWPHTHRWLALDTTHWGTRGVNPLDAYRAAGPRVTHVHLSDFGPQEHHLPGTGQLPLASLLQAMASDGFSGTVSLELDPFKVAFTDRARLRQQLAEALAFCREHLRTPAG